MKYTWLLVLLFPVTGFKTLHKPVTPPVAASPLSNFSTEWNQARYSNCNTAANASYLTAEEKKLIYIINLMRANPKLFANTVTSQYPDSANMVYLKTTGNFSSLLSTLRKQEPLSLLYPDSSCFVGAQCHAITSGRKGYVGHERITTDCRKKWVYNGECCDYGHDIALDILMALLIDEGVPSLGHRTICLSGYNKIGVSIQPHTRYGFNTVMDFLY